MYSVSLLTTDQSLHCVAHSITHNMYRKSMLNCYESPMNRGRRHLPQNTHSFEWEYTSHSSASDYDERYRSCLKYHVNTDPRKVRDHIFSSLCGSLVKPSRPRSSTYPVYAEEESIRRPGVRYVKRSMTRGLGSMAYYTDNEYEPYVKGSRVGRGMHRLSHDLN
jgi:hypothetical protein